MKDDSPSKQRLWLLCDRIAMHNGVLRLDPHDKDDQLIGSLKVSCGHIEWRSKYQRKNLKLSWKEFDELLFNPKTNSTNQGESK